jgi:hypothetical protein
LARWNELEPLSVDPLDGGRVSVISKIQNNALGRANMNRILTFTGIALLMSLAPALAADNSNPSDAAAKAMVPSSGSPDKSSGAAQSTSTPPGSSTSSADQPDPAAKAAATVPPSGGQDKSSGAAQSTSTPPKSGY